MRQLFAQSPALQVVLQPPPVHAMLHLEPAPQSDVQLPPVQATLQVAPGAHSRPQSPPRQLIVHVLEARHATLQSPAVQPITHVVPMGHSQGVPDEQEKFFSPELESPPAPPPPSPLPEPIVQSYVHALAPSPTAMTTRSARQAAIAKAIARAGAGRDRGGTGFQDTPNALRTARPPRAVPGPRYRAVALATTASRIFSVIGFTASACAVFVSTITPAGGLVVKRTWLVKPAVPPPFE